MLTPRTAAVCLLCAVLPAAGGCNSSPAETVPSAQAPADSARLSPPKSAAKLRPKLLPGAKTMAQQRVGNREYDKTFDDLRFDIEAGQPFRRAMLTTSIEALDGRQIRIRGFILPTPQKRGIKQFVLVRDNQQCCFGPGAALFDCILVEMSEGRTAEYTIRPVAVTGKFNIQEIIGPDGQYLAIYHIAGESVE